MNHKTSQRIEPNTATALVVIGALAAILVGSTAATGLGTGHTALATKGNDGINLPTDTKQKQECQTAGGVSPITASCTAVSTNTITQTGGVISEEDK